MIRSLLIANRGEIAVRIARTCRRLGIRTIAVYSDADRHAPHVAAADVAYRIGPSPARESYLRIDAIIEAARKSGAEAVHPGYGFLSEKPEFAQACADASLVFVGPSARRIAAMGQKIAAKQIAAEAGVLCVPGYAGDNQSDTRFAEEANRIGFPVMVKASAGGGGRGMRRVFAESELRPALDLARKEAEAAFGDPALLIEKLVLRPRHLEVQVAGDRHGNVVHLFERDCSVQRNNQKIFEEAPAPNLPEPVRAKLLKSGVALAKAIGYDNLGTVEFILEDGQDEPWFLEMNTRLQVEHPVTEAIAGFDLVEWQLRIASGERLPALQADIFEHGHAIEARVTAERADANFQPDAGTIVAYREPTNIRIDSGVAKESEITLFYDSLLAKAIASGATRNEALSSLSSGLREFTIAGPVTTIPFLIDALDHPIFREGRATTRFIEDAFPNGWSSTKRDTRLMRAVAAALFLSQTAPARTAPGAWGTLTGFRLLARSGGRSESRVGITDDKETFAITLNMLGDGMYRASDGDGAMIFSVRSTDTCVEIEIDDRVFRVDAHHEGDRVSLFSDGVAYDFRVRCVVDMRASASSGKGSGVIVAPMPGIVADVRVAAGDSVEAGQIVATLESMKLFNPLASAIAGTVTEVSCTPGATVMAGTRLLVVEPLSEKTPSNASIPS